jgi:hypothetical protein
VETSTEAVTFEDVADENKIDVAALMAYCWNHHIAEEDCAEAINEFHNSFIGEFDSAEDFVHWFMDEEGDELPNYITRHVNWEDVVEYDLRHDFWEKDGFYFRG